jgi:Arc/MetJ family transcription regulator
MRTNIVIDDAVVDEAKRCTGIRTKRELVDLALREIVRRHRISKILELEGALDWEGNLFEMRQGRDRCES